MKSSIARTIAGVTLILASLVCVVLFVCIERPRPGIIIANPGGTYTRWVCPFGGTCPVGRCPGFVTISGPGPAEGMCLGWTLHRGYESSHYFPAPEEYIPPVTLPDPNDETVKAINAALDCRDIRLNIDDTATFADMIQMIKDELRRLEMPEINIALDKKALEETGEIRSDTLVARDGFEHTPMRLRSVLSLLLQPHDLTYMIRDETLFITTIYEPLLLLQGVWVKEQYDKWVREKEEKREDINRNTDPERIYMMSMQTYGMLLAGLVLAWLAYFLSGLCFLVFARDKSSSK
jgi:hypothetical protein